MISEIQQTKAALREEVRARLRAMPAELIVSASKAICTRLREMPGWVAANYVLLFSSMPQEPDIMRFVIEAVSTTKTVALPRYSPATQNYIAARIRDCQTEFTLGKFNVLEPRPTCPEVPLDQIDLVLVPGVAFDLRGGRLGRGKGFYDRLLANVRGTKYGVAFDEQIVPEVPVETQDIRMNYLVTPTQFVAVGTGE